LAGCTVVDAPSVLITHFAEIVRRYAPELLSREDLQRMLDKVKQSAPTVVEDLKPDVIRMGVLHQVLVQLLSEGIPVTNLPLILESVVHHAAHLKDPVQLTERVRGDLGRTICDRFRDEEGRVRVLVCEPQLEMSLREAVHEGTLALTPAPLERLIGALKTESHKACLSGGPVALLTDSSLRRALRQSIVRALPDLHVIAYSEIPGDLLIEPLAMMRHEQVFADDAGGGSRAAAPARQAATAEHPAAA
jgi:flagellar biosynthesis protein FlhA